MISGFTEGRKYKIIKDIPEYIGNINVYYIQDYKNRVLKCEYVDESFMSKGVVGVKFYGKDFAVIPLIDFDCFDYHHEVSQEEMEL